MYVKYSRVRRVSGLGGALLFERERFDSRENESYQKRGDFSTGDSKPRKHLFKVRISEPRARIYQRLPLAVLTGGTREPEDFLMRLSVPTTNTLWLDLHFIHF